MQAPAAPSDDVVAAEQRWHELLLELAGRAPDGWLAMARELLAERAWQRFHAQLDESLPRFEERPLPRYHFTPESTGDEPDRAAAAAVRSALDAAACWVTSRDDADRVYLVQADDGADLPTITATVQRAIAGHVSPRVEVFGASTKLPTYHETALRSATLLWSRDPSAEVKIARTFDGASPAGGPWFDSAHELVVDAADRRRILDFLGGGEVVLETELRMRDLIDASGSAGSVPVSLRSDGVWVWSEASRYYLERHLVAPDAGLAEHALANLPAGRLAPLDRHRVWTALNPQNEEEPLWRAE